MNALEPHHLRTVERWTLMLSALVILVATLTMPARMALAAAVGAGIISVNAWVIRKLAQRIFRQAEMGQTGLAVILLNAKMLVLVAIVWVGLKLLRLDPIGFLIGISIFPVAIVAAALHLNLGAGDVPPNNTNAHSTGA